MDALEKEEEILEKAREMELNGISDEEILDDETENAFKEIVTKRAKLRLEHKLKRHQTSKNVHK